MSSVPETSTDRRLVNYVERFDGLRAIFDNLPLGILVFFDRETRLLAANKAIIELLGVNSVEELANRKATDMFQECCPELGEVVTQTIETGQPVVNYAVEVPGENAATYLVNTTFAEGANDSSEVVLLLNDITRTTQLDRIARITRRHGDLLGNSPGIRKVRQEIDRCASYDVSVVLYGETGTGKELAARAIHQHGPRSSKSFVPVNCGAIPAELIESQLFGHVKGAFTGASTARPGRFRRADGGTLFLDEVATLSLDAQVKLLRVLEDGIVEPIGSEERIPVDVRVIAASNQDLASLSDAGEFREDLLYRLKVVQIDLPPLRDRRSDIPLLAEHFTARLNHTHSTKTLGFTPEAKTALMNYTWPGNVRELENAVEHAIVMTQGPLMEIDDLPAEVVSGIDPRDVSSGVLPEAESIRSALRVAQGSRSVAAESLDMHRTTLWRKMKEHGIPKDYGKS